MKLQKDINFLFKNYQLQASVRVIDTETCHRHFAIDIAIDIFNYKKCNFAVQPMQFAENYEEFA